ncbi:cytochrome c oxidase subunit Va [Ancylostoma duodenale]|uniref:Cytochrome c oxidase subunit 5A, mitochondrial n=1 Tax=Ancylostoma duodenale TaxID=51022 RepID=A0A0C2BJQ2_9BILA|nr:cytochrome c oxidase subunit Va [Ancylostoma duodenale]
MLITEFDKHFIDYFNRPEIDGWEVRKGEFRSSVIYFLTLRTLTELHDYDVIPDPKVVEAALRACRRVNDFSLCVRFLEAIKIKCGSKKNREIIYNYIIKEVRLIFSSRRPFILITKFNSFFQILFSYGVYYF